MGNNLYIRKTNITRNDCICFNWYIELVNIDKFPYQESEKLSFSKIIVDLRPKMRYTYI